MAMLSWPLVRATAGVRIPRNEVEANVIMEARCSALKRTLTRIFTEAASGAEGASESSAASAVGASGASEEGAAAPRPSVLVFAQSAEVVEHINAFLDEESECLRSLWAVPLGVRDASSPPPRARAFLAVPDLTVKSLHKMVPFEERSGLMAEWFDGQIDVMVSTDLAARGIDTIHVTHVVQLQPAVDATSFLHRVGRAGRLLDSGEGASCVWQGWHRPLMPALLGASRCGLHVHLATAVTTILASTEQTRYASMMAAAATGNAAPSRTATAGTSRDAHPAAKRQRDASSIASGPRQDALLPQPQPMRDVRDERAQRPAAGAGVGAARPPTRQRWDAASASSAPPAPRLVERAATRATGEDSRRQRTSSGGDSRDARDARSRPPHRDSSSSRRRRGGGSVGGGGAEVVMM